MCAFDNKQNSGVNVALYLRKMASERPYHKAVICPAGRDKNGRVTYTHLTFQQLDRESDCMAHGLEQTCIKRGVRTVLMVKPGKIKLRQFFLQPETPARPRGG